LSAFFAKAKKVARRRQLHRLPGLASAPSSRAGQPEPAHPSRRPAGSPQRALPPDA